MANPRYTNDLPILDGSFATKKILGPETIIVVVGTTVSAELLDRPVAGRLRDEIDRVGGRAELRRAIVIADEG